MEFDWDEHNEEHIAHHGIQPREAEEALLDPRRIPAPVYRIAGEQRRGILGQTDAGRLLFIVFIRRSDLVRVITARMANMQERHRYERHGK